jgi:RNA polymerase sporulation-specific sigma factor
MNDYELVYLIRTEQDEIALSFMFKKYHKFIWKHIHLLNIQEKEHDDFHQEGLQMLYKAIWTFDEKHGKSFTKYFELILKRQFYQCIKKIPTYILYEDSYFCDHATYIEEEKIELSLSSELEQTIYTCYFEKRMSIKEIAETQKLSKKQIYNSIFRIKEKYKMMV